MVSVRVSTGTHLLLDWVSVESLSITERAKGEEREEEEELDVVLTPLVRRNADNNGGMENARRSRSKGTHRSVQAREG
jgi:hypothetical protein